MESIWRTGTCLYWTVEYNEDWYWVCSGLMIVRRASTGSVVDCRLQRGPALGL